MREPVIAQLIDLNNSFYDNVAESFHRTRGYSWKGWQDLLTVFAEQQFKLASLLDLGCGNGRFYGFIRKHYPAIRYLGVDANPALLQHARKDYREPEATWQLLDILRQPFLDKISGHYDLITVLGVMHHIPGHELRLKLLQQCRDLLAPAGKLVITFWDFRSSPQTAKKIIPWSRLGIAEQDLEEHDYLLGWQDQESAYRYCHYYTEAEIRDLLKGSGLKMLTEFSADGPGGKSNIYVVCSRS